MNIFGIPLFVPMETIESFLCTYLFDYVVSSDVKVILFFLVNWLYLYCVVLLIKFVYKLVLFIKNHVFD